MGFEKFDQHSKGKYWVNYFNKDKDFYQTIENHIAKAIAKQGTVGINIGAGPGIGALLIAELGFTTTLTGFEPSDTCLDGEKLARELSSTKSSVKYKAVRKGI